MRSGTLGPIILLLAVAVITATGACLVHVDDHAGPDVCASLLAVTFAVTLVWSLHRAPSTIVNRLDGYHPFVFEPPAPPPKA